MSRFTPNHNRPEHLVASIVALAEQSNRLALDAAMEAARADATGQATAVVDQICRLAVGAGVAAGEIAWLVGELESSPTDDEQLARGRRRRRRHGELHDRRRPRRRRRSPTSGAPIEITAAAEALRRVADQLAALLPRLQFCV